MDHGRFGPQGALGGQDGAPNRVVVTQAGREHVPEHLSKAQDIPLGPGDRVRVCTPGGGGYGDPLERDPALVAEDVRLGRYSAGQAEALFGVVLHGDKPLPDTDATARLRAERRKADRA
jgi:N-methylhydantoinase B